MSWLADARWRVPDHVSLWGDLPGVSLSRGWIDARDDETHYRHSGDKSDANGDLVASRQAICREPGIARTVEEVLTLQSLDKRRRNLLTDEDCETHFVLIQKCGHWPRCEDSEILNRIPHLMSGLG